MSPPDLTQGIALERISEDAGLVGKVGDEDVWLVRRGQQVYAIGAQCTHYHGALSEGLLVGDTVRCPLHHACFDVRTGAVLRGPALDDLPCWRVEHRGAQVFVRDKLEPSKSAATVSHSSIASIVIVGGGAAGLSAALSLRRAGYAGALSMLSADDSAPYDRPNLSKDYLAGTAPEEWMPLRPAQFYREQRIELSLNSPVEKIDIGQRQVTLGDGRQQHFDRLLLATGAEPVHLNIPGSTPQRMRYLRSFADSRAIIAQLSSAKKIVVLGASFIALETAAALRARKLEVHVVGQESVPLERVLGADVGRFVQALHESNGVRFHLGATITTMDDRSVTLSDGSRLPADLVIAGVGVRPATLLAEQAGLATDRGVLVDEYLQTSAPGVFAAGDNARWPDPHSGARIRVEHWVVAERQGQVAARNMLGAQEKFDAVPFFWSQHYDTTLNYVGHAERWDSVQLDGSLQQRNCTVCYIAGARTLAVANIGRDRQNLQAEVALEQNREPPSQPR